MRYEDFLARLDETQEKKTHYLYNDVLPQEMAQEVKEPELMKQMFNL